MLRTLGSYASWKTHEGMPARSVRGGVVSDRGNPLTTGPSRAPARAMLKAVGFTDADLKKPLIGVANTWIEIGPCNYHLRDLAVHVKAGIRAAGGTPMEFNTVSISDGITMGTEGMRASLVSREVIADSIELVTRGNGFDGLVVLVGCDKTIPGGVMALARLNIPGRAALRRVDCAGALPRQGVTIQEVFEAVGAHARRHDERRRVLRARRRRRVRAPARAAASSPPTRWRSSASSSASPRSAAAACRPPIRRRPRSRAQAGERVMGAGAQTASGRATSSRATALENAIAVGRDDRRIDQRRAAPDRDRARSRASSSTLDDFDRISARTPLLRRPQAVGALRRDRSARGRRQPAGRASGCSRPKR